MSKSRRGKSASTNEISRWEQELLQAPFNEDSWKSSVVFTAPNSVDDNIFLDILSDVIATGLRKLFSVITYDGLIKDAREYGKPQTGGGKGKGAASSKPPPFHEVCEQVKGLVDQGEPISPALMAKLLKFKLLHIKQKDFDRREEERKAAKAAESGKKDDKGGKKSHTPSGKRSKSPGKVKKGKKGESDMPPSPKKESKLKKRGDVEDTFKTIDDEPDENGSPQHYVIIHGVLMAPVLQHLSDMGISVDAIIRVKAESYERFKAKPVKDDADKPAEVPEGEAVDAALHAEDAAAKRKEAEKLLETFWAESDSIVLKAPSGHRLKDIAKYEVVVKDRTVPEEGLNTLDGDKRTEFGTVIFEDVAVTCYDMLDHYLQYKQYLDAMKLLHIRTLPPTPSSGLQASSVTDIPSAKNFATTTQEGAAPVSIEPDKRYYNHLMEGVPPDSQSVPLILNCLLEQVCAIVDENNPLDKEDPPREDGMSHLLASYIMGKAGKLALKDDEKQSILEPMAADKKPQPSASPSMLYHGDQLTSRLHHLTSVNGLDPMQAELSMLQHFSQNKLMELPPRKERETAERAARANELRHFCAPDVDSGLLEHALKQYAFEGMLLKVANEEGEIIDPRHLDEAFLSYSNPWDYPYTRLEEFRKVKFCSDDSGQLKISALDSSETPLTSFRNLDDWCFMEHLDHNTLLQVLKEAQFTLPYLDTYYHKRDHTLLLALHNPVGQDGRSSSSWNSKLHSNVGFRNYLDHVVSSIDSWVQEKERAKREATRTPTPPPPAIDEPTPPLKVGSRYGLMTRSEMNALKAEEEEKAKKGKGRKSARGSRSPKRTTKPREKEGESPDKKDKKREGSAGSRPKSGRTPSARGSLSVKSAASKGDKPRGRTRSRMSDPEPEPEVPLEDITVEEHFDFIGYDVGDNLIHASGSLSTLFPCDGGQIRVDKTSYVQGPQNVRVSVYKDGNIFVLHFLEPTEEILTIEEIEGAQISEKAEETATDVASVDIKEEGIEKSETEGNEKETKEEPKPKGPKPFSDFSSFVAQFSDGMTLTHSGYGPSGRLHGKVGKEPDSLAGPVPTDPSATTHGTPSPQPAKVGSPKARKKADEDAKRLEELQQQQQEEERARLVEEANQRAAEERQKKPFQNLYITCPDGLHLEYFNDGTYDSIGDRGGVGVRQRYPVRGGGKQHCDEARLKPAMEEQSRTVLTDGTIIKLMTDGSVQVLFPDGALAKCPSLPIKTQEPVSKPNSASGPRPQEPQQPKKSIRPQGSQKSVEEPMPVISVPGKIIKWTATGNDGRRIMTQPDGEVEVVDPVLMSSVTCPESGQVLRTREDNVVTVERPDGTFIVEHADGSRITTFYRHQQQQTQAPDNELGSQAQYSTVSGKFVQVECPGFSTLVFECKTGSCQTLFGNGVEMKTAADGETVIDRLDGSRLHLDAKGVMSFVPRELADKIVFPPAKITSEPSDTPSDTPAGVYVMRTNRQNCCELQDTKGSRFCVISNGNVTVERDCAKNPESRDAQTVTSEEDKPASLESTVVTAPLTSLVPRYFIIHVDGTGSELLRECDVRDFLSQAEKDPATALLRAPVEGHPGVTGITVMRPYSGGISKIWLRQKDEDTIIPRALRERDFKSLPSHEDKTPGPKFGTNVGAGVSVGTVPKQEAQPLITCPRALEFRQLIQYRPLTLHDRQLIVKAIENYSEYVEKREKRLDSILPQDPREESEKLAAEQLELKMAEAQTSTDPPLHPANDTTEINDDVQDTANQLTNQIAGSEVSKAYVDAITPEPVPKPPPPRWKRPGTEWERDKIELAELEYGKHALRYQEVPNYFETAQGQEFLRHTYTNVPDMDALTASLAQQSRHPPPGEASIPDTPVSDKASDKNPEVTEPSSYVNTEMASPAAAGSSSITPSNLRPTNPTPAHATDGGTPTPLRPTNPTPAHAASKPSNSRPSNPTPKHAMGEGVSDNSAEPPSPGESPQWRNNLESVQEVTANEQDDGIANAVPRSEEDDEPISDTSGEPKFGPRSLYIDVSSEVRKEAVRLPTSILSSRPGALPNTQFMEIEDPVRRRVHTVSVAGGNQLSDGRIENLRGFELLPPKVSFGTLKEGCTYINTVLLKNVGIDSCRFKVKQPPPSTGLRVLYNPGPVAAGMSAKLDVEIFAVAVGVSGESGVGHVGHHVEIVTETDALYLPVYATILTSFEYENRFGNEDSGISKGTRRVPNRPPSRDPTRPRKAEDYELIGAES